MKRWSTHSCPPDGLRRGSLAALAGALVLAAAPGCVTRGTHLEVVEERDQLTTERARLTKQVQRLTASNRSLDTERAQLLDDIENLRQEEAALQGDLRKLRKSETLLSQHLREREAALAETGAEVTRLRSTYESLVADLESELAAGQIEIEQLREGLRLNLTQDILFASGSAQVNEQGRELLQKVSTRLQEVPHRVEVQGHSDNVPISRRLAGRYPTNWELAGARASQVVRVLAESGVAPDRLVASSYGPFHPVAANDSPEGRASNRRIEIRLEPIPDAEPSRPARAQPGP